MTGALLIAAAAGILWHVQGFPAMPGQKFGPAWFPGLIAVGLGACGAVLVGVGLRQGTAWLVVAPWMSRARSALAVGGVIAGLLFYILAAETLGFHITGVLLLGFWMRLLGGSWPVALSVAVIATLAIHLSFYKLLRIPLPWGVLERFAF